MPFRPVSRLKPGARVAVIAPAGPFDRPSFEKGLAVIAARYTPIVAPDIFSTHRYLAGDDARRLAELRSAFAHDAIFCARGGYGVHRLLPSLSAKDVEPKPLIGFSDITALHALYAGAGYRSLHAPVLTQLGLQPPRVVERLFALLESDAPAPPLLGAAAINGGAVEGPLLGGNLSVLTRLIGTPFMPSLDGAVLLIEDVGERPYRLDRMFMHLKLSGALERVAGFALGDFTDCDEKARSPGRAATDAQYGPLDVLGELIAATGRPCVHGLAIGHGAVNQPVPLGARVRLDTAAARLDFLEPLVGLEVKVLDDGVTEGVFPFARAEAMLRGKHVISAGNAPEPMCFDLASLTKVMSATALCFDFIQQKKLSLDSPVIGVTVADLLFHRSGLPAFLPLFAEALTTWPELHEEMCPPEIRAAARAHVVAAASAAPRASRHAAVYSDLGFIVLGELLETAGGSSLDELFAWHVARPLALTAGYRRLSIPPPVPLYVAPTGATRPREPAPGQEGMWTVAPRPTRPAEVDDDNAWAMDGVSGHAGLFGTARDVMLYGQAVLEGRFAPPPGVTWGPDKKTPDSTRTLGFDTPSAENASCGPRIGRKGPKGAIGHTGFTGTSLWIDLDRELVVALCTNRVALGRANVKIREYRARFHEAVLEELHL